MVNPLKTRFGGAIGLGREVSSGGAVPRVEWQPIRNIVEERRALRRLVRRTLMQTRLNGPFIYYGNGRMIWIGDAMRVLMACVSSRSKQEVSNG